MLAILTVNSAVADTHINTDGVLTLREAIEVVNQGNTNGLDSATIQNQINGAITSNNIIRFDPSLNGDEILLDRSFGQLNISGHSDFTKSLTIDASNLSNGVIVDANDPSPGQHTGEGIRAFNITDFSSGTNPPSVEFIRLTIRGGDVSLLFDSAPEGGAIRSAGLLTLIDCTITGNSADRGGGVFVEVAGGGEVPRDALTVLTVIDCLIKDNDAFTGGGVAVVSGNFSQSTSDRITIEQGTIFRDNEALSGSGGGLFADLHGARLTVADSTFEQNSANAGGGAAIRTSSINVQVDVERTAFRDNIAGVRGGGLWLDMLFGGQIRLADSTLSGNSTGFHGGGLYANVTSFSGASLAVENTECSGNAAAHGGGAAVHVQGAWVGGPPPDVAEQVVTISRSLFSDNAALVSGGGLYLRNQGNNQTLVQESRVTGNRVQSVVGLNGIGGGIYAYVNGYPTLARTRITIAASAVDDNKAGLQGGGIFAAGRLFGDFVAVNATISGNRTLNPAAGAGGGMYFYQASDTADSIDAYLRNVTITQN